MVCTQLGSLCWFTGLNRSVLYNTSLILLHPAPALAKSKIISSIFILKGRDQFNQNFGPKLNGSVRSNRKSFEKTGSPSTSSPGLFPKKSPGHEVGPPFEVDHISRSDRLEFWLNGSCPLAFK